MPVTRFAVFRRALSFSMFALLLGVSGGTGLAGVSAVSAAAVEDPIPVANPTRVAISKTADTDVVTEVGQEITYRFVLNNVGNYRALGVVINEVAFSGTGPLSLDDCPVVDLEPASVLTCESTYTVTQADFDSGQLTNTAVAAYRNDDGLDLVSPPATAVVAMQTAPGLSLVKSADVTQISQAGQEMTYSFFVTNTGNTTLDAIAVEEGDFSGTGTISAIDCPTATLAPAVQMTCTATYTVTQADLDSGSALTNTATAAGLRQDGTQVVSEPSTSTVGVTQTPGLELTKSADTDTATAAGQEVAYSFLVHNTGNVTVSDVAIREETFSGTGTLTFDQCPQGSLAPGAAVTCDAVYTVTQADLDSGRPLTNTATAVGLLQGGTPVVSEPSTSTVGVTQTPGLELTKTADTSAIQTVGQVVTYSFLVRNTGNVTVSDVMVNEEGFTGHGKLSDVSCPADAAALAPAAEITCSATYTVISADTGAVTNTATVSGIRPDGTALTSESSTVTISVHAVILPEQPGPATPENAAGAAHLPTTGGDGQLGILLGTGVVLVVAGALTLTTRRYTRRNVEI